MKAAMFLTMLVLFVVVTGCGPSPATRQAEFQPATDATRASWSDYSPVYLVYMVDKDRWYGDQDAEPSFLVDASGAYLVPQADRAKLKNIMEGTILLLPTFRHYVAVFDQYGEVPAKALVAAVVGKTADAEGKIKVNEPPAPLIANTDYDSMIAVRCFLQAVKPGTAEVKIIPPGPQSTQPLAMD